MVTMLRRLIRGQRGQAIVETAMVLPVVVILMFGMLDAGRIFHAWIITTNAAREGARAAAAQHDEPVVLARVDAAMGGITGYEVATDNIGGETGTSVSVSVSHVVEMVTPLIGAIVGERVTVQASAVMRLE